MAKVDMASGEIEEPRNTDCTKCVHLENCESGKQRHSKSSGVNCRSFEEDCDTCEHETDDSGYCTECYYGDRWQRKGGAE